MISVTKLIDLLNKPALLFWANQIGLEGVKLKDYQSKSKSKGNFSHKVLEDYFNKGIKFEGFEVLESELNDYEFIGCEVDTNNGFILGRIDLIMKNKLSGETWIFDFKSNKNIYLNTKLQLSTYKHIYNADKIGFINTEELKIVEINIDTKKYFDLIKRLYQIKNLLIDLNERL
tara:strand:- start:9663 stop:10184 length:522 start_codon:yes stop_codon:yes gene_type:complete